MATDLNVSELRSILKDKSFKNHSKFSILQNICRHLNNSNESVIQEIVLRVLNRKNEFSGYQEMINSITRQIGLYPYLEKDSLNLSDSIAFEFHRPEGLEQYDIVFHSAQAKVYFEIMSGTNIILSAPTSFGKSLIIDAIIASNKFNNIAIVLPTIALIDETRRRLYRFKDFYKIVTHASQSIEEKNIFILTQERVIEFINDKSVDFFIIDEFYKLQPTEADQDRSFILNQALYKLLKKSSQFYLLGPNIDKIANAFPKNFDIKFIKTDYKTVVSEIIKVKKDNNDLDTLLNLCQNLNESTLVYCSSPNSANKIARAFIDSGLFPSSQDNSSAIEWISENYHPDWLLPKSLQFGVGLHHGRIPRSLSQLSVRLFNEGKINFLICTSTLIEGVNTKAKNVIIFDNKIARKKFDYFTFNNICGRSGRMFQHFIGRVYLFNDPPKEELPLIEFPILSQDENIPERLLIHIDQEDLGNTSKTRLRPFTEQDLLSIEVLKRHSSIDLKDQLNLAKELIDNPYYYSRALSWTTFPTNEQLDLVCKLIWDYFIKSGQRLAGVSSAKQLSFKLKQLNRLRTIKALIDSEARSNFRKNDIGYIIEDVLDFIRFWASHTFPKYLSALNDIQKDIFERLNYRFGDYRFYIGQIESLFTDSTFIALDEYGIPIQISSKLINELRPDGNLDNVLKNLKNIDLNSTNLTSFEAEIVKEVQDIL